MIYISTSSFRQEGKGEREKGGKMGGWGDRGVGKKKELLIEEKIQDQRNLSLCLIIDLQNLPKNGQKDC